MPSSSTSRSSNPVLRLLRRYRAGRLSNRELADYLRRLPYQDLSFAKVDLHRGLRRGYPEVIYGQGKTPSQVVGIAQALEQNGHPILITRVSSRMARQVRRRMPGLRFFAQARILAAPVPVPRRGGNRKKAQVMVISAGTSDLPVAEEAAVTLELLGQPVVRLHDVGVAGLHRLLRNLRWVQQARVIVVVAGMDGALPSVVSGLTGSPVVAVPTSVGYGASFRGVGPLLAMLNSCSPGVAVVNIDNGFGAGYLAAVIAHGK